MLKMKPVLKNDRGSPFLLSVGVRRFKTTLWLYTSIEIKNKIGVQESRLCVHAFWYDA